MAKYNTPDNPQQDGDLRNRIGEMYFMRGYFHMLLVRMYGEAPYIDRVINAGDNMDFKKESVHSMVEKIVADARTAYEMVPNKYVKTSENFGRVDKGACLGLVAFVRWMAATPLWNGASQYGYNQRRVFENEYVYDANRWRRAKEAAKAVLDLVLPFPLLNNQLAIIPSASSFRILPLWSATCCSVNAFVQIRA